MVEKILKINDNIQYLLLYNFTIKSFETKQLFFKITCNFVVSYRACHSVLKLHVQMYIQFTELLIK